MPLKLRNEVVPGAALFKTAGAGMAWPGSGAQGHPSRVDVSYPVSTVAEARAKGEVMERRFDLMSASNCGCLPST